MTCGHLLKANLAPALPPAGFSDGREAGRTPRTHERTDRRAHGRRDERDERPDGRQGEGEGRRARRGDSRAGGGSGRADGRGGGRTRRRARTGRTGGRKGERKDEDGRANARTNARQTGDPNHDQHLAMATGGRTYGSGVPDTIFVIKLLAASLQAMFVGRKGRFELPNARKQRGRRRQTRLLKTVQACTMIMLHACTMSIVLACTMIEVHASCPTCSAKLRAGGGRGQSPLEK